MTSQRHLCHHISIYDVWAFVLSLNIFVCAYFNEGAFHVDSDTPIIKSSGGNWTKGSVRGEGGGVDEVTHRYE